MQCEKLSRAFFILDDELREIPEYAPVSTPPSPRPRLHVPVSTPRVLPTVYCASSSCPLRGFPAPSCDRLKNLEDRSGSTATATLITQKHIYFANCGASDV